MQELPFISFIIPTFNSGNRLSKCINSINSLNYPKDRLEIIVSDGGSTDSTRDTAVNLGAIVVNNPGKYAEPGKAYGVDASRGEFLCFVDDDNYILDSLWLRKMITPLMAHDDVFMSEPMWFDLDDTLTPLQRYWALSGINDPSCLFLGVYDRAPASNRDKWHSKLVDCIRYDDYDIAILHLPYIPTIGANGALFRASIFKSITYHLYLDVDKCYELVKKRHNKIAKVRVGISHSFAASIVDYKIKTVRKSKSFYEYGRFLEKHDGNTTQRSFKYPVHKLSLFILHVVLVVPMIAYVIRNYVKFPDPSWAYHFQVCVVTLYIYTIEVIMNRFGAIRNRVG